MNKQQLILISLVCHTVFASQCRADDAYAPGVMGTSTLALNVSHGDPQRIKDKEALKVAVADMLKQHKYEELEKLAESIRSNNVCYPDGRNKLAIFYDSTDIPQDATEAEWTSHFEDLKTWLKKIPKSKTAQVALLTAWTTFAWKARGSGYSDTVSSQQWADFSARLKEGHQVLDKARANQSDCPHLFVVGQQLALGEQWPRPEYDKFYNEGIEKFPDNYQIYFRKVYYLQPRWHGGDTEWPEFAAQAADKVGGVNGDKLYARIAWHVESYHFYDNIFTDFPNLKWARIKKGFEAILKEYPNNNYVLNSYCKFARQAADNTTAKNLMIQIGNNADVSVWSKKANFLQAQKELLSNPVKQ